MNPEARAEEPNASEDPSFTRGLDSLLGASEMEELDKMSRRDSKRASMEQRGFSPQQIAAYVGEKESAEERGVFYCAYYYTLNEHRSSKKNTISAHAYNSSRWLVSSWYTRV